ncbi:RpiB/LacA/LacB family sugar-phosphate isomerase, partial [Staphylococcus epidermidis]|uniref:RpiB/LacA/LacB family sugar-phosphate isomerase n=1 Tax=Staphylococcus epidermidis TaxID=1282 RepID=UPI00119CC414
HLHPKHLKQLIKDYFQHNDYHLLDLTEPKHLHFLHSTLSLPKQVQNSHHNLPIPIHPYPPRTFILPTKINPIIPPHVSHHPSPYITPTHNNPPIITIPAQILPHTLANNLAKQFLNPHYHPPPHQIPLHILNKIS